MSTPPPSPPRHQDRRHPRPGLQHARAARADDPQQGRRGAAQLQPRHGAGPHRPRRPGARGGAPRRPRGGDHGRPAGPEDPRRQVRGGQGAAGSRAPSSSSTASRTELGDIDAVGLDYKDLPRDVKPGDSLLLNDGLIVLSGRRRQGRRGPHHGAPGRRAVEQQGHQQAGRRPHGAGADGQGHGRHQDRDELPGRLRGGELPEERHRHGNGAPAVQHGGAPSSATSRA